MNRSRLTTALALTAGLLSTPALANIPAPGDYNGDGVADLVEFRPQDGMWYGTAQSHGGAVSRPLPFSGQLRWGMVGDVPVPGDYDGNGTTDIAVWRPSNGVWYVRGTDHEGNDIGQLPLSNTVYGLPGDVPVPGDYDGNGTTDVAVWRPSNGHWYIIGTDHGGNMTGQLPASQTHWGWDGDIPLPGDYDGNGTTDLGIWRPDSGLWYFRQVAPGGTVVGGLPASQTHWGWPGDIPVPADYDGNGTTDLAVWRPSTGEWYFRQVAPGGTVVGGFPASRTQWGAPTDIPVPMDYNGDGTADLMIRRPATAEWKGRAISIGGFDAGVMPMYGHIVGDWSAPALQALEAVVDGVPTPLDALADLPLGASLELTWVVDNAHVGSCGLEPSEVAPDAFGTDVGAALRVISGDEVLTLFCDHPTQGRAVEVATVSVQLRPPSITAFTVAPAAADAGAPLTVNWDASDATDCTLTHGGQMLDGVVGIDEHIAFMPGEPVELHCENAVTGDQDTRVEQVALNPLALDHYALTVDGVPTPYDALVDLRRGSTVEFSWGVRNAYLGTCALAPVQPDLGAIGTEVGSAAHVVEGDARLTLYCAHPNQGRNVVVANVRIIAEPPPSVTILTPEPRPHFVPDSGEIAVAYEAETVVDCRLDSSGAAPTASNTVVDGIRIRGTGVVPFTEAITITVICRDRDGGEHRADVDLTTKDTGFDVRDLEIPGNPFGYVIENDNVNDAPQAGLADIPGDLFGLSLAALGDLNADGVMDLAVGAPGFDQTNGRVFVMDGDRHSGVHALSGLAATDYRGSALPPFDCWSVSPCGGLLYYFRAPETAFGRVAPRERLGAEIRRGGDINGDGHADLIVGSPYGSATRPHTQGAVYVVFGGPDLDPDLPLSALEQAGNGRGFVILGAHAQNYSNYNAGITPSLAGYRTLGDLDVNGDGLQDVVVAAPGERPEGSVYVVFGKRDDAPVELADLATAGSGQGFRIDNRVRRVFPDETLMGGLLTHAGDLNADGLDDISLATGGSYSWIKGAYVVYGKTDDAPIVVNDETGSEHIQRIEGSSVGSLFSDLWGDHVGVKENSGGFDVNGDGRSDLVVSSTRYRGGTTGTDEYFVFFGGDDPSHRFDPARIEAGDPSGFSIRSPYVVWEWLLPGEIAKRDAIRLIDDINGDGLADIVISRSVPWTDAGAWQEGKIWVVFGKSDPATVDLRDVEDGIGGFVIRNEFGGKGFAEGLSTRGDIDGDGLSDLLFGSYAHHGASVNSGRAYVFYGGDHSSGIDFYGDDGQDHYVAEAPDARMVGGRGADMLVSAGGAAVIYGGAGDDVLIVTDGDFRRVKGGAGTDTLVIDTDQAIDLDALSQRIAGIEQIALPDPQGSVVIGRQTLLRLSDTSNTVAFVGDGAVGLSGDRWVLDGSVDDALRYVNGNAVALIPDGMDINTPPVIETSALALDENSGADVAVGDIVVDDLQGDAFALAIVGGTGRDAFYVNGTTLFVDGSVDFDFEAGPRTWSLQLEATDARGLVGTADVIVSIIDVNEHPTVALPARIDLDEGVIAGTQIATAVGADPDAGALLTYAIVAGNAFDAFAIDETTGLLTIAHDRALDFERAPVERLTVEVTDQGGLSARADIEIGVLDLGALRRTYAVAFNSGDRDLWSDDGTFAFPDLAFGMGFEWPRDDGHYGIAGLGALVLDFHARGDLDASAAITGGFVNVTLPATITVDIPDEVVPGEEIEIPTSVQFHDPQLIGETVGFDLAAGIRVEEGGAAAGWDFGGESNRIFDQDLDALDVSETLTLEPRAFTGSWDPQTRRFAADVDTALTEDAGLSWISWNSSLVSALDYLGLPSTVGNFDFRLYGHDAHFSYTWFEMFVRAKVDLEQRLSVQVEAIHGTMTFPDGSTREFIVGDTVRYVVPADSDGVIQLDLDFDLEADYVNASTFVLTVGKRWLMLDATLRVDLPCVITDPCWPAASKPRSTGTNGPAFDVVLEHSIPSISHDPAFRLGGFETKSFRTVLDVRE